MRPCHLLSKCEVLPGLYELFLLSIDVLNDCTPSASAFERLYK
jgi:hypothetical protein